MLAIDDLKKLAEMQIHLLKMTSKDRDINLEKYKDLVIQIDKYNFDNFLSNLDQISAHNQSLEVELQYLEHLRDDYQQLVEQQLLYKNNYELYGGSKILLSNLSIVNVDYLDIRINAINGYLVNKLNFDNCKKKIDDLNKKLLLEEKNKDIVSNRLLQLEEELKNNFINAEGRIIEDGQLKYISIVSEYKDLGYDVKVLLEEKSKKDELLLEYNNNLFDVEEKLNVAEICYKADSNDSNKRILDEIMLETLMVRYKLSMLKILDLISLSYDDYNLFKKKREDLLSLINYRLNCLKELNIHMSIDPFGRIKINEQIEVSSMFEDSVENICRIKREIGQLDEVLEDLRFKNNDFMLQLRNTKDMVNLLLKEEEENISLSNDKEVLFDDDDTLDSSIEVLDNQVVAIKDLSKDFNEGIVSQKTSKVIKRVNEMVNSVSVLDQIKEESSDVVDLSPELVIVGDQTDLDNEESLISIENDSVDSLFGNFSLNENKELSTIEGNKFLDKAYVQKEDEVLEEELIDDVMRKDDSDVKVEDNLDINTEESLVSSEADLINPLFEDVSIDENKESSNIGSDNHLDEVYVQKEDEVLEEDLINDVIENDNNDSKDVELDINAEESLVSSEAEVINPWFEDISIDGNKESSNISSDKLLGETYEQKEDEVLDKKVIENDTVVPVLSIADGEEKINSEIFSTVDPFLETSFFEDRVDDGFPFSIVDSIVEDDIGLEKDNDIQINGKEDEELTIVDNKIDNLQDEMPDAFWVVGEDSKNEKSEEDVLSFEEQVDKLLFEENKTKTKKLSA